MFVFIKFLFSTGDYELGRLQTEVTFSDQPTTKSYDVAQTVNAGIGSQPAGSLLY